LQPYEIQLAISYFITSEGSTGYLPKEFPYTAIPPLPFVFHGCEFGFPPEDAINMKDTNFPLANQFVKRTYRKGWGELKV